MIFENEQAIIFSVLIENNDQYYDTADLEDNPYLYKILRSYDNGLTWNHLATMKASDLEEAHDTVDLLNAGARKNNSFKDNSPTNIFGSKLKKHFPHSHSTGWDSFTNYKKEIDSIIDQSIDPRTDNLS